MCAVVHLSTSLHISMCVVCVSAPEHASVAINEVALILLGALSFFALQIFKHFLIFFDVDAKAVICLLQYTFSTP
jgi:hypothetical protein